MRSINSCEKSPLVIKPTLNGGRRSIASFSRRRRTFLHRVSCLLLGTQARYRTVMLMKIQDYDYDDRNGVSQCRDEDWDYVQNELIAGVRNDLEDRFDQFTSQIRLEFVDIVRERFELIQQQAQARRTKTSKAPSSNTPSSKAPPSHHPPVQVHGGEIGYQNQAAAFSDFIDLNGMTFWDAYTDPTLADSCNGDWSTDDIPDSAYCSADSPKSA